MRLRAAPAGRGAKIASIAAALLALGALVVFASRTHVDSIELAHWDKGSVPAFTLPDATGADVPLASAGGKPVLVHFFATWCEACREELPALNRLAARGNVKVIAISVAEVGVRVRRFAETMPVNYPILLDSDRAVSKAWSVSTLPTTLVLDTDLEPRLVVESRFDWDSVDARKLTAMIHASQRKAARNDRAVLPDKTGG